MTAWRKDDDRSDSLLGTSEAGRQEGSQRLAQVAVQCLCPEFSPKVALSSPAPHHHLPLGAPAPVFTGLCSKLPMGLPGVNWLLALKERVKLAEEPVSGFGQ